MEGKYKWLSFEGRGNKMFWEFCREFPKRENLQYSWGSDQIISKQTAWKHIHVSWGQRRTCFDQRSRKWNFFLTQHIKCILYVQNLFFILPQLCSLQRKNGLSLRNTYVYMNNHTCKEFSEHYLSYRQVRSHGLLSIMADRATDVSCSEFRNCMCRVQNDNTTVAKRKPAKKNCKSCIYNYDDLVSYNSNSPHSSHNNDLLPVGLLAQFVWVLHRYRRGQGFESCTSPNSFCLSFCHCKRCVYNCGVWFYFHIILHPTVQIYDFHIFITVL